MTLTVQKNGAGALSVTRCEFADLAGMLDGRHVSPANRGTFAGLREDRNGRSAGDSWLGGLDGFAGAEALARDGWQDGAKQASALAPGLVKLVPPPKSTRRSLRWDETGNELAIDRALAGQWDVAWSNVETRPNVPKVLSLACNFGGYSNVTHAQLFWCAAQMIVTANLLERAGYAVELRAVKCNRVSSEHRVLLDVRVKRADQPLRADTIAAVFGHAGVYRTFGHTLILSSPFYVNSGLGSPGTVSEALRDAAREGLTPATDYVLEHAYDMQTAAGNIVGALTKLTGARV